jgi:hypothetical protein
VAACLDAAEDGQKLRDGGAYRRARERFIACAADECPGEVRKGCVGWLGELDRLLPTVVFVVYAQGSEVADVRVAVDGEFVAERIDGKPVGLDPGPHQFRFEREGAAPVDVKAMIVAGEKERPVTARFGPEPSIAPPPAPPAPPSASPPPHEAAGVNGVRRSPPPNARPGVSTTVYALGAVGLACVAAGAILDVSGYVFLQQCNGDPTCSGRHERAEVQWRFVTGDVLLGAGVLSGVIAWVLWPRDARVAIYPRTGVDVASLPGGARVDWTTRF